MTLTDLKLRLLKSQKAGDQFEVGVLRYLLAEIQNKEIDLRVEKRELNDEDIFKVIRKQIKNRMQSIEMYAKGGRQDLVDKETKEMDYLKELAKEFPYDLNLEPKIPQK